MVDKVYKQRKSGPTVIVMGWCPAKNKAIALQVDENGRLVIDPEDLDTRYLRLDGLYPMTGDLDCGSYDVKPYQRITFTRFAGCVITATSSYNLSFGYHFTLGGALIAGGLGYAQLRNNYKTSDSYIRTANDVAAKPWLFGGYDGAAYQTVAKINAATTPNFEIPLAGDIIPVSTKTKSLGSAAKYWNQLFVDAILCSNSVDLEPATNPVIYFDHDGPTAEDSLRYNKTTNHLEVVIGGVVRAYCDATGWH